MRNNIESATQLTFLETKDCAAAEDKTKKSRRAGAFTDNMKLPVHRWFRYSAGFSAEWVQKIIRDNGAQSVLDPFAGSGTTLLAASECGVHAVGYESHPFVARVAKAKLGYAASIEAFQANVMILVAEAKKIEASSDFQSDGILAKCYDDINYSRLMCLRTAWEKNRKTFAGVQGLIWLLITSILRECSGAGTAQWQYVLPNKRKARVKEPYSALLEKSKLFAHDMMYAQSNYRAPSEIRLADVRNPLEKGEFDLVVTSPPYPNNYDYADATRLEMTFWGEIAGWGDLQKAVRKDLIRSCSQHSAAEKLQLDALLCEELLEPIRGPLSEVCETLSEVRLTKGGKKTYHTMVAAYFLDLAKIWVNLRKVVVPGGTAKFMIGDSAPYGVYLPCDIWLGELAIAAGFKSYSFEKVRDRNLKWKNRKHRVPLKEGILEVQG